MMICKRLIALVLILCSLCPLAQAANATPTPPPVAIEEEVLTPPAMIQDVMDLAYSEWETLAGKKLKRVNKYTEWRGKGIGFGWCGGYITWCMLQKGVPMETLDYFKKNGDKDDYLAAHGIMHVKEASVGKLLRGYQIMNRTTRVPQPGYLLVYACNYNKTIHIALVHDVVPLGNGKYRLTTLEGNMASRVKMYIHDYDMYAEDWEMNLSMVPEEERTLEACDYIDYSIPKEKPSSGSKKKFYYSVNCFLMTWVPGDELNDLTTPTPPPEQKKKK